MIGKNIVNKSQFAILNILRDRIEPLRFVYLHLGLTPSRYFDNHIDETLLSVGEQRYVVKRRARFATAVREVDTRRFRILDAMFHAFEPFFKPVFS